MATELSRQGLSVASENRDLRDLTGCVVIGGYGHDMQPGTRLNVRFDTKDVKLIVVDGGVSNIPYGEIAALDVEGRGELRRGGGFFGGGFGVQAAAEGMLIASLLNSLTSKSEIETIVGFRTRAWQLFLFWDGATPEALRRDLAPAYARLDAARQTTETDNTVAPEGTIADELAKLSHLHSSGALSADEYARAKRKLVD